MDPERLGAGCRLQGVQGAGKLGCRHEKMMSENLLMVAGRLQGREARGELGTEEVGGQGKPEHHSGNAGTWRQAGQMRGPAQAAKG